MEEDLKTVAAVERALAVMSAFRPGDRFLSLAELSERTGLYKSTILRLIQTLRAAGYLDQSDEGQYYVGATVFRLGRCFQDAMTPAEIILPALRQLVEATSESAGFQIRAGEHRMCLYRVDSPQRLRDNIKPGDLIPVQLGAAGKVIVAFTDQKQPGTASIRKQLVVHTSGETAKGMSGLAAPVFGTEGFIGALTVSGPDVRFDKAAVARIKALLLEAARNATERLGGDSSTFDS